jgi:hypothetical protein
VAVRKQGSKTPTLSSGIKNATVRGKAQPDKHALRVIHPWLPQTCQNAGCLRLLHKYPKDDWPPTEFEEFEPTLPGGERISLKLAERGTWIGDRKSGLWVRETSPHL